MDETNWTRGSALIMREKLLGIIKAKRSVFSIPPHVREFLLFTPERVVVARQTPRLFPYLTAGTRTEVASTTAELLKTREVETILQTSKHNFALQHSQISKAVLTKWVSPRGFFEMEVYPRGSTASDVVNLEKSWGWTELGIITSEKKYKWSDLEIPEKESAEFKDYENMLRPVFGDKLSARLAREREEPLW